MNFVKTPLADAYLINPERVTDERGFFARTWCAEELASNGLEIQVDQCNISFNDKLGTLRGMHYQESPHGETKIVRCTRGSIHDVIVDMRTDSSTAGHWFGCDLTQDNRLMLYVPAGFAHGFVTKSDETEVYYQMGGRYVPGAARGIRWDDPLIGIRWPIAPRIVSERDQNWPLLSGASE